MNIQRLLFISRSLTIMAIVFLGVTLFSENVAYLKNLSVGSTFVLLYLNSYLKNKIAEETNAQVPFFSKDVVRGLFFLTIGVAHMVKYFTGL